MTRVMENSSKAIDIVIDSRFQGPPGMGNGGYSVGLLAEQFAVGPVEVTLKRPIPLNTPLHLEQLADGTLLLQYEEHILAEALDSKLNIEVPVPPAYGEAVLARQSYGGFKEHPFPNCFVCGPNHNDGLHIFPGPMSDRTLVAAPWIPHQSLANESGLVLPRYLWRPLIVPAVLPSAQVLNPSSWVV